MKFLTKLAATVLILMTIMTMILPTSAMAASKTYKGSSSCTYTITTGKKDAKLTLKPTKGTRAQDRVKKNGKKAKTKTWKAYATFSVTVDGKTYTVEDEKVTVTLPANGTYTVTVECDGEYEPSGLTALDPDEGFAADAVFGTSRGKPYWKKDPSIKLDVNNWAKIKKD